MLSIARSRPIVDRHAQHLQGNMGDDFMEDDFEESYEDYTKFRKAPEKSDEKPPYNSSFEDVTQLSNSYGNIGDVFKTSEKQSRSSDGRRRSAKGKFSDVSLLFRRIYHWDPNRGETWTLRLEIQSTILRQAFKEIVQGFTSISLEQDPIVIAEPFSDLYFNRDRIQKAIKEATDDGLKKELELLEVFRKSYMEKTITAIEASLTEGRISAEDLWSLFPVGSEIILQNREAPEMTVIWCVVVKSCFKQIRDGQQEKQPPVWLITAEFTSFDGKQFLKVERSFGIGGFQGAKVIRALPAYPLDLHPQKEELRQTLVERGKKYAELCAGDSLQTTCAGQGSHRTYAGPFWEISGGEGYPMGGPNTTTGVDFFSKPTRQHEGRLVVDPAGRSLEDSRFRETIVDEFVDPRERQVVLQDNQRNIKPVLGADDVDGLTEANLRAEDFLTAPATIAAYSLTFKRWGLVMVDSVKPIVWKQGTYDMLQMDKKQKEVVSGVIESHHASSSAFDDYIPGKGRGLVFLLHGPPGSGKTMTAESAAETLQRPLYYISGAELGLLDTSYYYNNSIEEKLERIFKRVARWEAILLFDEADTFVASRGGRYSDGKRNALTSILLRMIEYQSGIIFLTTNRITDFDKALFSRVHITLKYEPLAPKQRSFIWETMAKQTDCDFDESDFERLSRIPLDGRTIKNILRVASLHVKIRERNAKNSGLKMGIADVKAVLRFAIGDIENKITAQKVEEFYNESSLGIENITL